MDYHERPALLRKLLDAQPCFRVSALPTPLMDMPQLSAALGGPRILIKRDDMTGLAYGGNKARLLDYFIGEAKAQGCDVFIGGGGAAQSNHALMCAAAARKAGMKPIIFALAGSAHYELQGDFLLTKMLVDQGVYVYPQGNSGEAVRHKPHLRDLMEEVAQALRIQGHNPYILAGSGQPAGALGYVECALELTKQCETMNIRPDWIFLNSTGCGQAGLLLGASFLGQTHTVVGIAPGPYGPDAERAAGVAGLGNRTAHLLGIDLHIDPATIRNRDYSGGAYGIPTPHGLEALHLTARSEGVFLDPIYTSKAMAGLIDHIRQGVVKSGDTVIFIHTGGLPLNFAYSDELTTAFDLSLETDIHLYA